MITIRLAAGQQDPTQIASEQYLSSWLLFMPKIPAKPSPRPVSIMILHDLLVMGLAVDIP